jgi:hypothetical protein
MTKLRGNKPLVRETDVFERTDPIIVELYPKHLLVRLKGKRGELATIDYAHLLDIARDLQNLRRRLRKPPRVKPRARRSKVAKDVAELQRIFDA